MDGPFFVPRAWHMAEEPWMNGGGMREWMYSIKGIGSDDLLDSSGLWETQDSLIHSKCLLLTWGSVQHAKPLLGSQRWLKHCPYPRGSWFRQSWVSPLSKLWWMKLGLIFTAYFIHLLVQFQQIFLKQLLCANYCTEYIKGYSLWGEDDEVERWIWSKASWVSVSS